MTASDGDGATPVNSRSEQTRQERDMQLTALVARSGGGDKDAFALLYEQIAPVAYGVAVRVLRDKDLAAETAQDVLLEIWEIAARFDSRKGSVLGWVSAISHRRAVDQVRSVEAQRRRDASAGVRDMTPAFNDVEETVTAADEAQLVRGCLETLAENERELVTRAYYSGRTYRQVAEETETPVGTVKSRIRSGLKRLAQCLGVEQ